MQYATLYMRGSKALLGLGTRSLWVSSRSILDLVFARFLCTNFIASIVYLMRELLTKTIVFSAISFAVYIHYFFASNLDFSVSLHQALILACFSAFLAAFGLVRLEREASKSQPYLSLNPSSLSTLMAFCILLSAIFFWKMFVLYSTPTDFPVHPTTGLILNARSATEACKGITATHLSQCSDALP
jgi:hypothetical protein